MFVQRTDRKRKKKHQAKHTFIHCSHWEKKIQIARTRGAEGAEEQTNTLLHSQHSKLLSASVWHREEWKPGPYLNHAINLCCLHNNGWWMKWIIFFKASMFSMEVSGREKTLSKNKYHHLRKRNAGVGASTLVALALWSTHVKKVFLQGGPLDNFNFKINF